MDTMLEQYRTLWRQIRELETRMAALLAKMEALCAGLREEGLI